MWKAPWYWVSDFLINYYVTICLVTTTLIFAATTGELYLLILLFPSIIYDIFWKKNRLTICKNKYKFISIFITQKFNETDESTPFSLFQRVYLIILFSLQSLFLLYESLYAGLAFSVLMGGMIYYAEYFLIKKSVSYIAKLETVNYYTLYDYRRYVKFEKECPSKILSAAEGGFGSSSYLVYTKSLPIIFIPFFYLLFLLGVAMTVGLKTSEGIYLIKDDLIAISTASVFLFGILFILFFSAMANRAREIAKQYLKIINGGKQ